MADRPREPDPLARSALPPLPALHWKVLAALAVACIVLHALAWGRYGYFRDELYYLASTRHLGWGYVEHPPLSIAVLAVVRSLIGDSVGAIRIVPILCGAAVVFLSGAIARQLGGGRFAQALAGLCALWAGIFLALTNFYSMNALELLFWTIGVWLLLRALRSGRGRDWIVLGAVLGLGLLNKISVSWLIAGMFVGLLLTPARRELRRPWPWLAAAIAFVIFSPYLIWNVRNGWPTLEFMRNATGRKMADVPFGSFMAEQVFLMTPGNAIVWIGGIVFGLSGWGIGRRRADEGAAERARTSDPAGAAERDPAGARTSDVHRARLLVWIYLTVLTILLAMGRSRSYYLSAAYPGLFAAGAVGFERLSSRPRGPSRRSRLWIRAAVAGLVVVTGMLITPVGLPILPVESFVRYQKAIGMAPRSEETVAIGPLPQHFADMFGWDELARLAADAYSRLTPEERARCRIFGHNYGEAGAIDVIGRRLGLPQAISGHNSYWLWGPGAGRGPGAPDPDVVILLGGDPEREKAVFGSVEVVGRLSSPWAMPYERGLRVMIGRGLKRPLREMWPSLKDYI